MQLPTLSNVHIRSASDAHKLFYAVQLGLLDKIEKRLDAHERSALRPGDVYVWEEKGPSADSFSVSMERFTEGKSWTASRVREDFLMYFETQDKTKGRSCSQKSRSSENQVIRPGENDQFIKQTYSVVRNDPDDMARSDAIEEAQKKPRKWHLNAYFTKLTEGQLRTIDDFPFLRDLQVPEGIFKSAKTSKGGKKGDSSRTSTSSVRRTFAPFPSNYRAHRQQPKTSPPVASTSSTPLPVQSNVANSEDRALQCTMPIAIPLPVSHRAFILICPSSAGPMTAAATCTSPPNATPK
ncbi:Gti1/Pac2 family-domain-containing protein [Amylocystis lapponica]|nr:Gti1/Pac2 family-domain-containing protein [Amylocystis lapponica]